MIAAHEADDADRIPKLHTEAETLALTGDGVAHPLHFVRLGLALRSELAIRELSDCRARRPTPARPLETTC